MKLDLKGRCKMVYHNCIDCGKERLVRLIKDKPERLRCKSCSNKLNSTGRECSPATRKRISDGVTKHGASNTKLYHVWLSIKDRCYNSKCKYYKYYGSKGIAVCDEWLHDFATFRDWAFSNGYREGLTIDRIANNNNYEPSNCQWLTRSEHTTKDNIAGQKKRLK